MQEKGNRMNTKKGKKKIKIKSEITKNRKHTIK